MKKTFIITLLTVLITSTISAQNGVYLDAGSAMTNSIVFGNIDTLAVVSAISGSGTISYTAADGMNFTAAGKNQTLETTPFAGKGIAGIDKYAVIQGNPINSGNNEAPNSDTDAAGYPRKWDNAVDLGAYEWQFPRLVLISAIDTSKIEGATDPELQYAAVGDALLKDDIFDVELVRAQGETVDTYIIDTLKVKILRSNANLDITHFYTIEFQTGIFTIKANETLLPEINNTLQISVYPTVTTGILHIDGIENQVDISVFSLSGMKLMQKLMSKDDNTLDISALKTGTFVVKISGKKNEITKKVIKK
jgi:hypothetical protein